MRNADSRNTIKRLKHWFASYGYPNQIVSYNGAQFTSSEFTMYMKTCGIKHIRTPAYHQSSNGQAERYVQTLKKGLKCNNTNGEQQEKVDEFLMTYRSTPSTVTEETPAKLFLGRNLKTRLDVFKPQNEGKTDNAELSGTKKKISRVRKLNWWEIVY